MSKAIRLAVLSSLLIIVTSLSGALAVRAQQSTLVIGFSQEPPNLFPLNNLAYGGLLENFYVRNLWEFDVENTAYPVMATEIPSEENGRVVFTEDGDTAVTVTLREGMLWSDGTPITAADCEVWHTIRSDSSTSASVNRAAYPSAVSSFEIDAEDPLTFTITYNGLFPDYVGANERPECQYPGHIFGPMIEDGGVLEDNDYFLGGADFDGLKTVGYGPYAMESWDIGSVATFVRNPFWDGPEPAWDRVVVPFIAESAQMRNALQQGEIDVAFNWGDDQFDNYASIADVEVFNVPSVFADALWIRSGELGNSDNHGGDALMDVSVRQAIAHAIDRINLAEELVAPGIPVPPAWYPSQFWPDDLVFLEYNPDGARALLDEAGWVETGAPLIDGGDGVRAKDGVELSNLRLVSTQDELRNNYQIFIQDYLAEIGIGVDVQIIPATTLFASFVDGGTLTNYEWDLAVFAYSVNPLTPVGIPTAFGCEGVPTTDNPDGFNPWQFCDPEYDEIDRLLANTLPGPEREELTHEAVRLHTDFAFWNGLRTRVTWYAVYDTVVNPESVAANVGALSSNWFAMIELWEPAG